MFAQFLSQIAQDRRGSVAQIFALALIPVAFMAGAAIDYTRSVAERSELQVAVDAAVLAGAKDASQTWTTTAANVFKAAYKGTASAGFTKDAQGAYVGTASASVPTTFVGIAGIQQIPIGASGKAAGGNQADTSCILTLDTGQPVSDASLTFNGAPNVALSGCTIRSNTSLKCNGHSTGALASIAAGTATGCSNPQSGAAVVPDIYAELAINITKQCSAWPGVTWVPGTVPPSPKVVTLMKPTHTEYHVCGDLTLSGSGDLTGGGADTVIVIENGRLILDGDASIQTSRVAFVLTGDNTKASAIEFPNGNGHAASLTLSPPTGVNNPWRGVSVYQDPALTFQVDADWGPGATLNADGLVYLPKADLKIHGNPSSNNPICTKLVLNSFTSSGSVNLNQTAQGCENLGVKQWKGPGARITG
ncbi:MAG: TadE/TadG family type IV pilus assembly protein [Microvirga sp.]